VRRQPPADVAAEAAPIPGWAYRCIDLYARLFMTDLAADPRGRDRVVEPGAEGATAPETLRPKDRGELALWKAAMLQGIAHRRA
jgi:hypothetical protein